MDHLDNLNDGKKSDDEKNKCTICPISQSEIDAKDISSTVSVISNTTVVGEDEIAKLIALGFVAVQQTHNSLYYVIM